MLPKRIGIIGFDGVVTVDLAGPADAFSFVKFYDDENSYTAGYEVIIIASTMRPFTSDSNLVLKPHATFKTAPPLDTIIVPGGIRLREPNVSNSVANFIRERAPQTRRLVSVCAGLYGLAASGLLGGRRVTTHWRYTQDVAARYPALRVENNSLFIKDGPFYTSAGCTAGIDLALFLIEEDYGPGVSLSVARDLVVYVKRSGGQEQYSEPLRFQGEAVSRVSDLSTWILTHLNHDLSVETLAARACLCPRQFCRRFKREVGVTPGEFVQRARIDEARRRLAATDTNIDAVAESVGFKSSNTFRRIFERRLGLKPVEFRRRFNNVNFRKSAFNGC